MNCYVLLYLKEIMDTNENSLFWVCSYSLLELIIQL